MLPPARTGTARCTPNPGAGEPSPSRDQAQMPIGHTSAARPTTCHHCRMSRYAPRGATKSGPGLVTRATNPTMACLVGVSFQDGKRSPWASVGDDQPKPSASPRIPPTIVSNNLRFIRLKLHMPKTRFQTRRGRSFPRFIVYAIPADFSWSLNDHASRRRTCRSPPFFAVSAVSA